MTERPHPSREDLHRLGYDFCLAYATWEAWFGGKCIACSAFRENVETVAREHHRSRVLMGEAS
jgi:hypothetical protein